MQKLQVCRNSQIAFFLCVPSPHFLANLPTSRLFLRFKRWAFLYFVCHNQITLSLIASTCLGFSNDFMHSDSWMFQPSYQTSTLKETRINGFSITYTVFIQWPKAIILLSCLSFARLNSLIQEEESRTNILKPKSHPTVQFFPSLWM